MQNLAALILAALALAHTSGAQNALGWETVSRCAEDYGSRVIAEDITTQFNDNTPTRCIEHCDASGYLYAGVEFSNECHCGTGLKSTPVVKPASECNMSCTGDSNLTCGGPLRIQIYKSPALPSGKYSPKGCYRDVPELPALKQAIVQKFPPSQNIAGECTSSCQRAGYRFAGVKGESICKCSQEFNVLALPVPDNLCHLRCDEDWCMDLQGLQVFHYEKS